MTVTRLNSVGANPTRPYFFRRPSLRLTPRTTPTPPTTTPSPSSNPSSTTTQRPVRSPPRRRFTTRGDALNATSTTSGPSSNGVNTTTSSKSGSKSPLSSLSAGVAGNSVQSSASQKVSFSTTPKPRFKFASRRPFLTPSTSTSSTESSSTSSELEDLSNEDPEVDAHDQMLESSIQRIKSHEHQDNSIQDTGKDGKTSGKDEKKDSLEQIGDIGLSLHPLNRVVPGRRKTSVRGSTTTTTSTERSSTEKVISTFDRLRTRQRLRVSPSTTTTTPSPPTRSTLRRRRPQPQVQAEPSVQPQITPSEQPQIDQKLQVAQLREQPQQRVRVYERTTTTTPASVLITTGSYRPITIEYDYYDEGDVRIVGQLPANSKVLIHSSGAIQCLDQGNFPHPVSCKKFIACARMERGDVIGWEYTCPQGLSFDPVGGICNWAAGLGCRE